jgi:tetratricopeptide (TPR) repeat protein
MVNWSILYRFALPAILAVALTARVAPAQTGQLDASPTLFTVMAAVNAAGFDADAASGNNAPIRQQLKDEILKRNPPSLAALKAFVAKHHLSNPGSEFGQYVSFALSVSGPPKFEFTTRDVMDVPPDAATLHDLSPLLAAFYKEADIDNLWKRSQKAIDSFVEHYHQPVSDAVLQVSLYLRQPTSGVRGRHFQIFLEPQGPPNQIQIRSYGNEYTIVVTPSPDLRIFDIRHGYLHYVLDPLAPRNAEVLERKKVLAEALQRAHAISEDYRQDFPRLVTESLIKAVEARLDKRPQDVEAALKQGYILTPYFAEAMVVYEKQQAAMQLYYTQLVQGIDLKKEEARLENVQFDRNPPPAHSVRAAQPPAPPAPTGAAKTLDDAEQLYTKRDLDAAKKQYLEVLSQTSDKPMQGAAYYGLGRIALLQKDPETGERMLQKSLDLDPEPQVKAWVLVYLGRLSLAAGEGAQAGKYFSDALQVPGASDMARKAAQEGMRQSSK